MPTWGSVNDVKWGDVDEATDGKEAAPDMDMTGEDAPKSTKGSRFVTGPDKNDIKTITQYGTNEEGKRTKYVKKVKVITTMKKINKNILERRGWKRFGDCVDGEKNVTYASIENINLVLKPKSRDEETKEDPLDKLKGDSIVVCRKCGKTGHWTLKCPERNAILAKGMTEAAPGPAAAAMAQAAQAAATGGKYVPVHLRGGGPPKSDGISMQRDDSTTLRVTNLSEDTTEDDLRDLFRRFGHTSRVYLAKDRQTQQSRGFAFINYTTRDAAQAAIDTLHGHGYANLILHVEFAKPREENPNKDKGSWSMRGTK